MDGSFGSTTAGSAFTTGTGESACTVDERYMAMAIQLAELGRGQTSPNPVVGAIVVCDGQIVGQGAHLRAGEAHAEVHALRMAGDAARGATVYVTLEPCSHFGRTPPCVDSLIAAGVARVVIAAGDPNPRVDGGGVARLRLAGIEVVEGVLREQAQAQNEAFVTWVAKGRPFVVWKCAATLDGYIAADSGHSQFVTGDLARDSVQVIRRSVAAIAVGVETAIADNPLLTVRSKSGTFSHQPLRVLFDSHLRTPPSLRLFAEPGNTLIYTSSTAPRSNEETLRKVGAQVVRIPVFGDGRVDLAAALRDLGSRGISSLLVEGGATLATALLYARLVDKVVYFVAPKLLLSGRGATNGVRTQQMNQAVELEHVSWMMFGQDACVTGTPVYGEPESQPAQQSRESPRERREQQPDA